MNESLIKAIKVGLDFGDDILSVGSLASREEKIFFEYSASFLDRGLEISPLRLALQPGLISFDPLLFEGLPGVFADSLPDGWGRLLLDRAARVQGIHPDQLTALDRLSHVGHQGMGALVYEPDFSIKSKEKTLDLNKLAFQTKEILEGVADQVLPELIALNGSSAGARPKAMIGLNSKRNHVIHGTLKLPQSYEPWLVKFSNTQDKADSGAIEYVYSLMAKQAGLNMMDTHLFPAQHGSGYFATKRFDRFAGKRLHVHTACGLLHSDFRTPSLDYEDLLALTEILTRDVREVEKMYRQAVFNVLAYNRDDHGKNFSFLMNDKGEWKLAPAYDLTFSSGPRGEQSTMVLGEGKNPKIEHLIKLGHSAKINPKTIHSIIDQSKHATSQWRSLAKQYGVRKTTIELIRQKHLLA